MALLSLGVLQVSHDVCIYMRSGYLIKLTFVSEFTYFGLVMAKYVLVPHNRHN